MDSPQETPLDEIRWSSLPIARSMGGIQTNTVLPYFSQSPFFDPTSNNAVLTSQATYNPNMFYLIQTRESFEGGLRSMGGLEFMVSHDPSSNGMVPSSKNSGIWVIRKQNRRKRPGQEDELMPLASYFVVGENIYMAPSLANIVGSRMLSTVGSLCRTLKQASTLPIFTPSLGYTYFPPIPTSSFPSATTANSTQPTSTQYSSLPSSITDPRTGSPQPGTEPLQDSSSTLRPTKSASQTQSLRAKDTNTDTRSLALLTESFNLSTRYAGEYMDETPLIGEPGSFIMQKSSREAPSSSQPQSQSQSQATSSKRASNTTSSQAIKPESPQPLPPPLSISTTNPLATNPTPFRKGSKDNKSATGELRTPVTPVGGGGSRDKKGRRKSKALGGGGSSGGTVGTVTGTGTGTVASPEPA